MVHDSQNAAANRGRQGHNFAEAFSTVLHLTTPADLTFGNLETVLGGPERRYKGYPRFNTPDSLAEALKRSGFDIVQTTNNHSYDQGPAGLLRTLDVLAGFDLPALGTFSNAEAAEAPWVILEAGEFRIGFLAYTFGTNGIEAPRGREYQVSTLTLPKAIREVEALRALEVDAVVVGLHWGKEYSHEPKPGQIRIAKKLIAAGADVLLGGHPHVLQPMEFIRTEASQPGDPPREGLVHYSLGNFISNMFLRPTELGLILEVTLAKPRGGGPTRVAGVRYAPTWVHKYGHGRDRRYFIRDLLDLTRLCSEGGPELESLHLSSRDCADAAYAIDHAASFYGTSLRFGGGGPTAPIPAQEPTPSKPGIEVASEPLQGLPSSNVLDDGMLRVEAGLLQPPAATSPSLINLPWDAPEFADLAAPLPPFAIDPHEVTRAHYAEYLAANPSAPPPGQTSQPAHPLGWSERVPSEDLANHPVTLVSGEEARAFCAWRGTRLPTLREWRMASGGPDGLVFPWGNQWRQGAANNFELRWADAPAPDGFERSAPVGSFPADISSIGAFDLSGNVAEWVEGPGAVIERILGAGSSTDGPLFLAGGSWFDREPEKMSSHSLSQPVPRFTSLKAGFRCARDLAPPE